MKSSFLSFLLTFAALLFATPSVFAQGPNPNSAIGVHAMHQNTTGTAPAAPAPAIESPAKPAARKEEEAAASPAAGLSPENAAFLAASAGKAPDLSWWQRGVAKVAGVPTEAANTAAMQQMSAQLTTLQTENTRLAAENTRLAGQLSQVNDFLTALQNTPETLRASDPAADLTPAQEAIVTSVNNLAMAELRACTHPPSRLPGPGAENPAVASAPNTDPKKAPAAASAALRASWGNYQVPGLS